jgi:hypothetical protein
MFVPLSHAPGEAQADFGEAVVVIAGVGCTAHFMAFDLPHSDDCFVQAFPAETTEAFLEGHVRAFQYFGAVPTRILYDNTTLAVARILGDGDRQKTRAFSELQSHCLFAEKFGRPGKGNDKGKVENLVGYARRNFMVPIPHAPSWDELNAHLEADCRQRRERRLRGHTETIAERFERDRAAMLPLPPTPYEACEKVTVRVSSLSLVRYRTNDYSVPTEFGHRQVLVKGYVQRVEIVCGSEVIARHPRSYEREAAIYDPLHYLALLEHKSRALDQAAPLTGWPLPDCFAALRRLLQARLKKHASREYIQVLRLLETFALGEVAGRYIWARSASMRCATCCSAASSAGRRGWTWPTGRTCPWPTCAPPRLSITWRCSIARRQSRRSRMWRYEQSVGNAHSRYSTGIARTSPEGLAPAHHPARVRQGGTAVRRGRDGLHALLASPHGTGVTGPRPSRH